MTDTRKRVSSILIIILSLTLLTACSNRTVPANTPTAVSVSTPKITDPAPTQTAEFAATTDTTVDADPTKAATPTNIHESTSTPVLSATSETSVADAESLSSEAEPPAAEPSLADILIAAFPETPQAQGEVVYVTGRVLDIKGDPIANAAVEFWQTDAKGIYDHPGDPTTANRDQTFQFYGTALSDDNGLYIFRTISPGYYEPRPKHIHLKIKVDGKQMLTSQFYFEEDRDGLAGEGLFRQAGDLGELLILQEVGAIEDEGQAIRILNNDIVVDTGIGQGTLTLTPSQGEGPYYPVVDVSAYDNDLAVK